MTPIDWLLIAVLAAVLWLMLIRPARVRREAQARLLASLAPGERAMTTAGLFGTIVAVDAKRVSLEVAPGVVLEMVPQAIGALVPDETRNELDEPRDDRSDEIGPGIGEADRG